jgi:hypothetical protein
MPGDPVSNFVQTPSIKNCILFEQSHGTIEATRSSAFLGYRSADRSGMRFRRP